MLRSLAGTKLEFTEKCSQRCDISNVPVNVSTGKIKVHCTVKTQSGNDTREADPDAGTEAGLGAVPAAGAVATGGEAVARVAVAVAVAVAVDDVAMVDVAAGPVEAPAAVAVDGAAVTVPVDGKM